MRQSQTILMVGGSAERGRVYKDRSECIKSAEGYKYLGGRVVISDDRPLFDKRNI